MTLISTIIEYLEKLAPLSYQESYDNAGLIVGNKNAPVNGVLICLDSLEAVVDEAIENNCNLIVCHHPIVFKGLKSITGKNYVEKVIIKAIKNDIAIYACHTNLDNVWLGVNKKIADKLGLINGKILAPSNGKLKKLYLYAPTYAAEEAKAAIFNIGAGVISEYSECSFETKGIGTFKPSAQSKPSIGKAGGGREQVDEVKLEFLFEQHLQYKVEQAVHKLTYYEEKAYEIVELANTHQRIGAGWIGEFEHELDVNAYLQKVSEVFKVPIIKYTQGSNSPIKKVALCGGSGSFLLGIAKSKGADAYLSADFKYHEYFDAEDNIVITDIGHFESEQYTSEIFYSYLKEKFSNFAILLSRVNTNPVKYFKN
jgi:dinuclear metal center YbgI/SA1388 family protein